MDKHNLLPFKIGQEAETKSFEEGYRGSWFRCKIMDVSQKKGHISYALEFPDYPDEKRTWTQLYQKLPIYKSKTKTIRRELMMRPHFPPVFHRSQMQDVNAISEVTVVYDGWKVGDLVDWLKDYCYWSGRVTHILEGDKVMIEFPKPPFGEGGSPEEALCKDLRPSLDWSTEYGWRVPVPMEGKNCRQCAWLINPGTKVAGGLHPNLADQNKDAQAITGSSYEFISSRMSTGSLPHRNKYEHTLNDGDGDGDGKRDFKKAKLERLLIGPESKDSGIGKTSCSDSVSSSLVRDASDDNESLKKMRSGGSTSMYLNTLCSDTLEATVLDLEELVNRVKWLKRVLERGIHSSNVTRPSWEYLEHRASSKPK